MTTEAIFISFVFDNLLKTFLFPHWAAIHAAEIGDGTLECESVELTLQMLDLMLDDKVILKQMCDNILKANEVGVYNGAYKVIELALRHHVWCKGTVKSIFFW